LVIHAPAASMKEMPGPLRREIAMTAATDTDLVPMRVRDTPKRCQSQIERGADMNDTAGLQVDLLKPHVRAIFDEARRVGPEAARAAWYEVEAKLPKQLLAAANENLSAAVDSSDRVDFSCASLHATAAVSAILAEAAADEGDLHTGILLLTRAIEYQLTAQNLGCQPDHD
jgi:hypothetical protein